MGLLFQFLSHSLLNNTSTAVHIISINFDTIYHRRLVSFALVKLLNLYSIDASLYNERCSLVVASMPVFWHSILAFGRLLVGRLLVGIDACFQDPPGTTEYGGGGALVTGLKANSSRDCERRDCTSDALVSYQSSHSCVCRRAKSAVIRCLCVHS